MTTALSIDRIDALHAAILAKLATGTPDEVLEVLDRLSFVEQAVKELKKLKEDTLLQRVRENGNRFIAGTKTFYEGFPKEVDCIDPAAAMDKALELSNGDMETALRDFFVSKPYKHGAFEKQLAPEDFALLFRVSRGSELREGAAKPEKKLITVDTRYVK